MALAIAPAASPPAPASQDLGPLKAQWLGACRRRSSSQSGHNHHMGSELRLSGVLLNMSCVQYLERELAQLHEQDRQDALNNKDTVIPQQQQPTRQYQHGDEDRSSFVGDQNAKKKAAFDGEKAVFDALCLNRCRFPEDEPEALKRFSDLLAQGYIGKRFTIAMSLSPPESLLARTHRGGSSRPRRGCSSFEDMKVLLERGILAQSSTIESLTFRDVNFTLLSDNSYYIRDSFPRTLQAVLMQSKVCDLGFHSCILPKALAEQIVTGLEGRHQRWQQQQSLRTLVLNGCSIDDDETVALILIPQATTLTVGIQNHRRPAQDQILLRGGGPIFGTANATANANATTTTSTLYDEETLLLMKLLKEFEQALRAHSHLQSLSWPQVFPPLHPLLNLVETRNYWLWRLRNLCDPRLRHAHRTTELTTTTTTPPKSKQQRPTKRKQQRLKEQQLAFTSSPRSVTETTTTTSQAAEIETTNSDETATTSVVLAVHLWATLLERMGGGCSQKDTIIYTNSNSNYSYSQIGQMRRNSGKLDAASPVFFFLKLHSSELHQRWEHQRTSGSRSSENLLMMELK
ncbi:hypothetical protein ACA910_011727 [Epithemia clementina (nom. ined.)]